MKASEVLRLYEKGERDFKGVSLRGQNFKGKDLSGADFSGADIRSTNFTNANLTGAKFVEAKAGLQRRWAIGLVVVAFLLSTISGVFASIATFLVVLAFDIDKIESQVAGWASLGILFIYFFGALRKGVAAGVLVVTFATAVTFALAIAAVVWFTAQAPGTLVVVIATAVAFVVAVAFAVAFSVAFAFAVLGEVAFVISVVFSVAAAFLITVVSLIAGIFASLISLFSAYIGWRALKGDTRDAWLWSVAVVSATFGGTSFHGATLTDANFSCARLKSTDFRRAVLLRTRWRNADKLDRVRPGETYLNNSKVCQLLLTGNGQGQSYDHLLHLTGINLQGANLVQANFSGSNLKHGTLQGANLANVCFIGADLNQVNLQDSDLTDAMLVQTQLDEANLTGSVLTGAYIEDWNITTKTRLNGIRCDYVFMRLPPEGDSDPNPHRKPDDWNKTFADGEFSDFIAPMIETLDLYHNQAVDPRAIAISYHDLQQQHPEAELEIVSMEKRGKNWDKLLLRAKTNPQADLSELNSQYFERYDYLLTLSPEALQALLIEKDREVQRLVRMVDTAIDRPSQTFVSQYHNQGDVTMSEQGNQGSKYDMRGAQFAGGYVGGDVKGNQYGGTINNYGSSTEDITRLLSALREHAQAFPDDQKDEALDTLDDLEGDLAKPEPDQGRIGRRLKRLAAISTALAIGTTGFAADLAQLAEALNVPLPQVQTEQIQVEPVEPEQLLPGN
ncbi:pentapeptide repeat-containing protein [Leptothoe sp. EHU-05/26/07-4]